MILLTLEDFTGWKFLARNDADDLILQDYIDRYEARYIREMLGVELGNLFIEDVQGEDSDSAAISDRFQKLIDTWQEQQNGCIYDSLGMKDALACMVYTEFICGTHERHGQSGVTSQNVETSNVLTDEGAHHFAEKKWNDAVFGTIKAIQWYCGDFKKSDYSEYRGVEIRLRYASLM